MPDHKVLKESAIVESGGCYPSRIVIRKQTNQWNKVEVMYCTHLEVRPPDRAAYTVSGNYDMSLVDAEYDLTIRFQRLLDSGAQAVINEKWGTPLSYHGNNPDCMGHPED